MAPASCPGAGDATSIRLDGNDPPRRVRWGEQTTDEMCLCGIQAVTKSKADTLELYLALAKSFGRLGSLLGGFDRD